MVAVVAMRRSEGATAMMKRTLVVFCSTWALIAAAQGADVQAGQRLAQLRCIVCHVVGPNRERVVAEAPPFPAIARKFANDQDALVMNLMGPHPKMNFGLSQSDAENIAAFITSQ
jgi:mono/diheme cytochrome c family protein